MKKNKQKKNKMIFINLFEILYSNQKNNKNIIYFKYIFHILAMY